MPEKSYDAATLALISRHAASAGVADVQTDVDDNSRETRRWFIDTARAL
jgi:hypothetical protein